MFPEEDSAEIIHPGRERYFLPRLKHAFGAAALKDEFRFDPGYVIDPWTGFKIFMSPVQDEAARHASPSPNAL